MLWYHNLQLQKYQDRRVFPYEMFPVLKDLKKESVTWERLFLRFLTWERCVLIREKGNETNSLLSISNALVHATVKYGWDFLTGVILEALKNFYIYSLQPSKMVKTVMCTVFYLSVAS